MAGVFQPGVFQVGVFQMFTGVQPVTVNSFGSISSAFAIDSSGSRRLRKRLPLSVQRELMKSVRKNARDQREFARMTQQLRDGLMMVRA